MHYYGLADQLDEYYLNRAFKYHCQSLPVSFSSSVRLLFFFCSLSLFVPVRMLFEEAPIKYIGLYIVYIHNYLLIIRAPAHNVLATMNYCCDVIYIKTLYQRDWSNAPSMTMYFCTCAAPTRYVSYNGTIIRV